MKNKRFLSIGAMAMALALVFSSAPAFGQSFSAITGGTMTVGSQGANVSALQRLLASNVDIYPAARVTGYYGPLTREAVKQFQLAYDLTPDGIAGPITRAKMNSVIAAGRGVDIYVPTIANVAANTSGRTLTVSFTSNEPVRANLYYDVKNIPMQDSGLSFGLPAIGGSVVADTTFGMNKQFTVTNLGADMNYYYTLMAVDLSGNAQVILPRVIKTD